MIIDTTELIERFREEIREEIEKSKSLAHNERIQKLQDLLKYQSDVLHHITYTEGLYYEYYISRK